MKLTKQLTAYTLFGAALLITGTASLVAYKAPVSAEDPATDRTMDAPSTAYQQQLDDQALRAALYDHLQSNRVEEGLLASEDADEPEHNVANCLVSVEISIPDDLDLETLCDGSVSEEDQIRAMNRPITIDWEARDAQHASLWNALNEMRVAKGEPPLSISEDTDYQETRRRIVELCQNPEQCTPVNMGEIYRSVSEDGRYFGITDLWNESASW